MTRLFAACLWLVAGAAHALPNPASAYCIGLGGRLEIVRTPQGEVGYCKLPDGRRIEEWALYRAYLAEREKNEKKN